MIENPMRRVAAILLTALLLMSTIMVVLPEATVSAASETNDISIKVQDTSHIDILNAVVKFTEVHTGQILTAAWSAVDSAYHAGSGAPSGCYRIDISASGYYSLKNITGFRFDGLSQMTLSTATLTPFGNLQYTYTVTVKDTSGNAIQGAMVKFYNRALRQSITSGTTNVTGVATLNIFGGVVLDLVGSALTYETNVTSVGPISSSASVTMKLNSSLIVYRDAKKLSGGYVSNAVAYMYNINPAVPWEKRVIKSIGSSVRFDAYAGNWILVIDGTDVNPYVAAIAVAGSSSGELYFQNQSQSFENMSITWSTWNSADIVTNSIWKADKTYPGLDFSDIGSLRAQVDLALGDADGTISLAEYTSFVTLLQNTHGPALVTTASLLHIQETNGKNNTQYVSTFPANSVAIGNFVGSVTSLGDITYSSDVSYTSQMPVRASADFYRVHFNATLNSLSMNRSYQLSLLAGYELTANHTSTSLVKVMGYTVVKVTPQFSSVPGIDPISLDIGKSTKPIAKGEILIASNTFAKIFNGTVLYYVVKNNTNVSFSSSRSSDPNGNPLTFSWDFGDAHYANNTKANIAYHNYTAARNLTVVLTVTDVVGLVNTTQFNVSIDGRVPRPVMKIMNDTGGALTLPVTIDQGKTLKFSPAGSKDDLVTVNDGIGEIKSYVWNFGSNAPISKSATESDQNVTYIFSVAGKIRVVLNATDVVGNWKNISVTISVNDKTAPTINTLRITNGTWGSSLVERELIYFNATKTTDNLDNISALNFSWHWGDGSANVVGVGLSFANVSHTYHSYGQYNLYLNVTDKSGNNASLARIIYVGAGPRPDVSPTKMTFSPKTFEEGVAGKILINITNSGSANATGITLEIWYYSGTVAQKLIANVTTIYASNGSQVSHLGIGESGYAIYMWTPDAAGNYTIRVYANSTDQKSNNWVSSTILVNEAGWKKTALYIGILVIVVVVPLLLLARRRIGSMGAMMRRPKKEKEGKEKKEEK